MWATSPTVPCSSSDSSYFPSFASSAENSDDPSQIVANIPFQHALTLLSNTRKGSERLSVSNPEDDAPYESSCDGPFTTDMTSKLGLQDDGGSTTGSRSSSNVPYPSRGFSIPQPLSGAEEDTTTSEQSTTPTTQGTFEPQLVIFDNATGEAQLAGPRKRGRPRKIPQTPAEEVKPRPKHRTKTGCNTCRKRKKKCLEERPVCSSCKKNNYACVYPETQVYRTGKERADEEARRSASVYLPRPLPSLFEGIESSLDRRLLHHFIHNSSTTLSMNSEGRNLFLVHIIPMAASHGPLMHALLALSASHLSHLSEQAHQVDASDPVAEEGLLDHQYTLHALAIRGMRQELTEQSSSINEQMIATNLLALLYTVSEGQTNGAYHQHLAAAKTMLGLLKSDNTEFCDFIFECIHYHATLSALLSVNGNLYLPIEKPLGMSEQPKSQLIGVYCGLFSILSRVSQLREKVRGCVREEGRFVLTSSIYADAADIDIELRQWVPSFSKESDKWIAAQLCQRAVWVYLRRTMSFPTAGVEMYAVLDDALTLFNNLSTDDTSNCCLLYAIFLLGCCAMAEAHRAQILAAFDRLHDYCGTRNVLATKEFTQKLWKRMDNDVYASWDWETVAQEINLDFLIR